MFLKEHNISVRLPQEKTIDTGITFVQNDKGVYKLNVRVFDGDTEINYSQVSSATITFLKADGTVVQGDMQKATNMLTYYLGTNEIAAPGKLIATIQLLGANERLTTARFLFRVEKDLITEDAVKSTSEFPILQKLKKELEEIDVVDLRNDLEAHLADNAAHGATASAIANRIVVRDESGGASFSHFGLSPTRSTTDLNDRLRNGWSSVDYNTPNTPEPGVRGVLFTSMWDNDTAGFQLFYVLVSAGADRMYYRRMVNRVWSPWVRIWHSGNTIVDSNGFIKEV